MIYDDDDHDLFLTPQVSVYSATKGGASRHMIVNGRNHRIAVKIKCSNNDVYRVSPVYCNLEPGQSVRLQVVRDAGSPGTDKLVVIYRPSRYSNPRDAFKKREGRDDSDIKKKLIGLLAKDDRPEDGAAPPPLPLAGPPRENGTTTPPPPPFIDGAPAQSTTTANHCTVHDKPTVAALAPSFSVRRGRSSQHPPRVPTSAPPPIGIPPPLFSKSVRRKPAHKNDKDKEKDKEHKDNAPPPVPIGAPPSTPPPSGPPPPRPSNRATSVKKRAKTVEPPPERKITQ